jgi:COP9 signalosome complex subunit 3
LLASKSSGNFKELAELLPKCSEVLSRNNQHLDTVLETLNVQQHSLGILAVLVAKFSTLSSAPDQADSLFSQFQEFIAEFNVEQVRCAIDICKNSYAQAKNVLFLKFILIRC